MFFFLPNVFISPSTLVSTQNYVTNKSKTIEEKLGIPAKPKKPLTPYFRFMKEIRPKMAEEHPKAVLVDIVRMVAKKWETVDEATKQKFSDEYKKDQIDYMDKRATYDLKLTDEQKSEIKTMKQDIVQAREKRATKKKTRELGKPKKASSSFIHFLIDQKTVTPRGKETYLEWQVKITNIWSKMTDAEKEKYVLLSKAESEKYR